MDLMGGGIRPELMLAPKDQNLADEFYRRLINWINDFHKSLDEEHEVGARLVNFGQAITFHVEDIGYWNPSLISFIITNSAEARYREVRIRICLMLMMGDE